MQSTSSKYEFTIQDLEEDEEEDDSSFQRSEKYEEEKKEAITPFRI